MQPTLTTSLTPPEVPNKSMGSRKGWDFVRFLQQSSKFVSIIPSLPSFMGRNPLLGTSDSTSTLINPGQILWVPKMDVTAIKTTKGIPVSSFSFGPLDDVVMGGVSSSTFDNDKGIWSGIVTDTNNGGFIGIRTYPSFQWDMSKCQGIELKLKVPNKHQGKRMKFVLRDTTQFNGICWTTSFDMTPTVLSFDLRPSSLGFRTKSFLTSEGFNSDGNREISVRLSFDRLVPTLFAKTMKGEKLRKDSVVAMQLAFSKFEYDGDLNPKFELGELEIQILEISSY
jgi:Complex I intermediate-associated protein 30 (CIA30)